MLEGIHEAIGAELNALAHKVRIHAEEANRDSLAHELVLNVESIAIDIANAQGRRRVEETIVKEAGKVTTDECV